MRSAANRALKQKRDAETSTKPVLEVTYKEAVKIMGPFQAKLMKALGGTAYNGDQGYRLKPEQKQDA